ncbi:MAG: bifunctional hydroxymethylpyrimidine kinase/phosphomethylpyrimidine kinase [Candidatus Omnitrophica bacterium]|nr:bifunctional hydroxymethylpyrimidine kinase/phosphomethylpyrimidine kinase [Candidatus Omnitrophota bacterium]MCB9747203.1 bifunctional hydroxymethylpyrimidine kinase/phosphomethylpyrimidine kinase [Candidatus Omnitrophota bacterium]
MSLIVLGTVALDNIKTSSGMKKDLLGGSAAHFSMSARLFTIVHLVGIIGADFPKRHIQFLRKKGIDLTSLTVGNEKSFRWTGEYKKGDYNNAITLATELGVLLNYTPEIAHHQRNLDNVFLANIDPDVQMKLLELMGKPKLIGLDSMNLWIEHKRQSLFKLMKKVDLFVANDGEACAITKESNLVKAAKALRKMGPKLIVVKKGEHGVLFYSDNFMFSFPAYPVDHVVDPTGAGDTFAGGLMGYLTKTKKINDKNLRKAVLYATTLASFNVEGFGMAKTAPLTMAKVNERMKELVKFIAI